MAFPRLYDCRPPWGGVSKVFLAENQSRIYPNMCAKFSCGPMVVSKRGGGTDTHADKVTMQLYIDVL